jgi:hypothetical protein
LGSEPGTPELVVSWSFWDRALGRDKAVIRQTIRLNNHPYTIAGVLPRGFYGLTPGDPTELYTLIQQSPGWLAADSWSRPHGEDPQAWWIQLIARRAGGVPLAEAKSLLDSAFAATWAFNPKTAESRPRIRLADATAGLGGIRRELGDPVRILLGLVLLVLIVACANIANLLLSRAAEREKEVALRVSLGCGSGRLMRQFLTESLLIALFGGAVSIAVALAIGALMGNILPAELSVLAVDLNLRLLAVTTAFTVLTALIFGVFPAGKASRMSAAPALKEGSGSSGIPSRSRLLFSRRNCWCLARLRSVCCWLWPPSCIPGIWRRSSAGTLASSVRTRCCLT